MAANINEKEEEMLIVPGQENSELNYKNINRPEDHQKGLDYYIESENGKYKTAHRSARPRFIYLEMTPEGVNEYNADYQQENEDHIVARASGGRGWKFHVSIDDHDKGNIEKGWNIVKDILISHNVYFSKVVAHDYTMDDTIELEQGAERGKQITIYMASHPNRAIKRWEELATDITRELARANVQPSYRPDAESDIPINGSHYVSFTCDGIDNQPIARPGWQMEIMNASVLDRQRLEEFQTIEIVLPDLEQPPIPEWHPPVLSSCPGCSTL